MVTSAHREEQCEEDRDVGSRVEFVVDRAAVHVGEDAEQPGEPVALHLDRRVVFLCGVFLYVDDVHPVEFRAEVTVLVAGSEADECRDKVLGGFPGPGFRQVSLEPGFLGRSHLLKFREMLLEGEDFAFACYGLFPE